MTISLMACSKGGVGKTSASVNYAARLAMNGRRVCLVDTNAKQHNAYGWAQIRLQNAPKLPRVDCRTMVGPLSTALKALSAEYDDLVVDAGGHDSLEMRAAMRVADIVIMPYLPSTFDLWSLEYMEELLDGARAFNENLRALAFINQAPKDRRHQRPVREAHEFMRTFDACMTTAETVLHQRATPIRHCTNVGRSVFEIGRSGRDIAQDVEDLLGQAQDAMRNPAQKGRVVHGVHTSA